MTDGPVEFLHRFEAPAPGEERPLLLLHGTGGDEVGMISIGRLLAPSFGRLAPRGQVKEGDLNRYFRRFAENRIDPEDARARAAELADFVVEACRRYGVERARLTAIGYSNGANTVTAMLFLRPDCFADAVLLRPFLPFEPPPGLDLGGRRVLVLGGADDQVVPAAEVDRHVRVMSSAGARVEGRVLPTGHLIGRRDLEAIRAWLGLTGKPERP